MTFRRLLSYLFLTLPLILAGGCIDRAYDLGRMDRDITVGGPDLTFPLGSTRQLTVGSLIDERLGSLFERREDETYNAHYDAEPVEFVFAGLKDYDGSRPFAKYTHFPISTSFSLFSLPASGLPFDADGTADLSGLLPAEVPIAPRSKGATLSIPRMPDQLLGLESMTLTGDSRVKVTFSIPDCPLTEGVVTTTVRVDLRQFFGSPEAVDGIVTVTVPLNPQNRYTHTVSIPLDRLIFEADDFDAAKHTLTMDASLGFSGSVSVSGAKTTRARWQSVSGKAELEVTAELLDLCCESIVGCFDYEITRMQTRVDLSEMTGEVIERIGDPDAVFDFADPEILLDVESNIRIPTYAVVSLSAIKGKKTVAEMKDIRVPLPVAGPDGSVTKRIRLAKTALSPDDMILDFTGLVRIMPDEIVVNIDGYTYPDRSGEVRVGQVYQAQVSPQVNIPLALGPELQLTLRDTLDFPLILDSLLRGNNLLLLGEITNTIPLQLGLELTAVSSDGKPLIETVGETIAADGSSSLSVPLTLLQNAQADSLSKAFLTFRISGTQDSRPVRATDYVTADLKVRIPGGFHTSF